MEKYAPLTPLIEQARKEGKWLRCHYQNLWFSPDELEAKNAEGCFRWGPVNWILQNPLNRVQELQKEVSHAQDELANFQKKI